MGIDEREVLRYLEYRGAQADGAVLAYIKETEADLKTCCRPRCIYEKWPCAVDPAGTVKIENIIIESKNLAARLQGCEWVTLLAATLGSEADTLLRRYAVTDAAKAAVAQAVCAAWLEDVCDRLEYQIAEGEAAGGLTVKPRFSPGYGDFHIRHQKDILCLLERKQRTGITLTDGFMMAPVKSVTALIGLTNNKIPA